MSLKLNIVTCPICFHEITMIPDGNLRYCYCGCLGVDCTGEYVRYIGTIPKEHENYNNWLNTNKDTIEKCRCLVNRK